MFSYSPQGAVYTDPGQTPATYPDLPEVTRAKDDLHRANAAVQRAYATALAVKTSRDPTGAAEAEEAYTRAGQAAVEALSVLHAFGVGRDETRETMEAAQAANQAAAEAALPKPIYSMVKELPEDAQPANHGTVQPLPRFRDDAGRFVDQALANADVIAHGFDPAAIAAASRR